MPAVLLKPTNVVAALCALALVSAAVYNNREFIWQKFVRARIAVGALNVTIIQRQQASGYVQRSAPTRHNLAAHIQPR